MTSPESKSASEKSASVRSMFGSIAPRYDLLNHLLSLNIDKRWRRAAVDELLKGARPDGLFVDGCAGTLDLALELSRRGRFTGRVTAYDFAFPMLERGMLKLDGDGAREPIDVTCADALRLPFRDRTFNG